MSEPTRTICLPEDHDLGAAIAPRVRPGESPVTVSCSRCGLDLSEVNTLHRAYTTVLSEFMGALKAMMPGEPAQVPQAAPPNLPSMAQQRRRRGIVTAADVPPEEAEAYRNLQAGLEAPEDAAYDPHANAILAPLLRGEKPNAAAIDDGRVDNRRVQGPFKETPIPRTPGEIEKALGGQTGVLPMQFG